jgi:large subunit ribosomal protein L22
METTHIQKYIHTSPRKLRLVAEMVRNLNLHQAIDILDLTPKAASKYLSEALKTSLANAKQKGMDLGKTAVKSLEINESMKMKRFRAGTRGRIKPYVKRMSHIRIVITDNTDESVNKSVGVSANEFKESMKEIKGSKSKKGGKRI